MPRLTVAERISLGEREVHLWYVRYVDQRDEARATRYRVLMNAAERDRHRRFVFARDRWQFLLTRALLRTTLSRYADVAPADWDFAHNEYGKPRLCRAQCDTGLHFNLSNTRGLIACAVTRVSREIGVDVEDTSRPGETVAIADRFFAASEVAELLSLPAEEQRRRFFSYWTLKESYIKARGMGLAIPLEHFAFDLAGAPASSVAPALPDRPDSWQFGLFSVAPRHLLALALRRGDGPDCPLSVAEFTP